MQQVSEQIIIPNYIHKMSIDFAGIYLHKQGDILLVRFFEGAEVGLSQANELIEVVNPYVLNGIKLGISDMRNSFINVSSDARAKLSNNKSLVHYKAQAALVDNLPVRILTNFFIHFNKPIVPFKMFSEIDEATNWLRNQ